MTVHEFLEFLDGRGLAVTDWEAIEKALYEAGIGNDAIIEIRKETP